MFWHRIPRCDAVSLSAVMGRLDHRSCRRGLAWIGVLSLHAVLIGLFQRAVSQHPRTTRPVSETWMDLLLPEVRTPQPEPVPPQPHGAPLRSGSPPPSHRISAPTDTSTSVPTKILAPYPSIDWHHEAELAGSRRALTAPSNRPGDSGHPVSPSAKCQVRPQQHWDPEPKRVGLAGGLPYVRLGRCVVGLGFFGCALSRPRPAGHLLDNLRDTDHDVLDSPDCVP